jgi:hypothetical protein
MKTISVPTNQDELATLVHKLFYGSFPCRRNPRGRGYVAYDGKKKKDRVGLEPDPIAVIEQHLSGETTWATRATIMDSDLKKAYFAAIDVDTTDESLLTEMKKKLDETYGPVYNWERSESGVHVWFIFEGSMSRAVLVDLIQLLNGLSPKLQKAICAQCPKKKQAIRLPFPGAYKPPTNFASPELTIIEAEDIARLLDIKVSEVEHDPSDLPVSVMHDGTPPPQAIQEATSSEGSTSVSLWDSYQPGLLKAEVDRLLSTPPVDGKVFHTLIMCGLMSKTIAAYGEDLGMTSLESWIKSGNSAKVSERIGNLREYCKADVERGYWTVSGPLCPPGLRDHFSPGLFEDKLDFIKSRRIRREAEGVLYILCVCHVVAEHLCLSEWFLSTRDLSEMLRAMGFEGYEDPEETGRKKAGRRLSWVVGELGENAFPAFTISKKSTAFAARRFKLNPEYKWLLNFLPEGLMEVIQSIPKGGRHQAAGTIVSNINLPHVEKEQSGKEDELEGPWFGPIPWDKVR